MTQSRIAEWGVALVVGGALGWGIPMLLHHAASKPGKELNLPAAGEDNDKLLANCFRGKQEEIDNAPLFTFDGKIQTFADMPIDVQTALIRADESDFRQSQDMIEDVALRYMALKSLGEPLGKTLPTIEEIFRDKLKASKEEVDQFYNSNKALFASNGSLDQARNIVERYIAAVRLDAIKHDLRVDLSKTGSFQALRPVPCVPPIKVETASLPTFGDKNAPQKLLFFTDFFGGTCREMVPRLNIWLKSRPEEFQVSVVVSQQPKDLAAAAMNRGLFCADQQGGSRLPLFLEQAHLLSINFRGDAPQIANMLREKVAAKLQLDGPQYDECIKSTAANDFVQTAETLTQQLSIGRAPVLFFNSRRLLLPLDSVAAQARVQKLIEIL